MFAFTITVSPYDQESCILGLIRQILGYRLFVLIGWLSVATLFIMPGRIAYFMNAGDYGGVEQALRRRVAPILVLARELDVGEMTSNTSHGHRALSQRLSEVKVERVILDVLVARVMLQVTSQRRRFCKNI